ncbi:hypothetical protein K439DRAFT_143397 [Ramaria rubella]|nr:hypothetical protein K439DRAFT_143397 [Ramaria rubella]
MATSSISFPTTLLAFTSPGPTKKIKIPLPSLQNACTALDRLDTIAETTQIPFFSLSIRVMKLILDIVQETRNNVKKANELTNRVCKFLKAFSQPHLKTFSDTMKSVVDQFCSTLKEILESLEQIIPYQEKFWTSLLNRNKIERVLAGNILKMGEALETFEIHSNADLHNTTGNIQRIVENLSAQSSPTPATSISSDSRLPVTDIPPPPRYRRTRSVPLRITHQARPPVSTPSSSPNVRSGNLKSPVYSPKPRDTVKKTIIKTVTTREIETNTKTTRDSVVRRPVPAS